MYPVSSLHFTSLHLQTKSLHMYPVSSLNITTLHFTSNKITSHKSRQFTPHHYTLHHFTSLQTKSLHMYPVSSLHIRSLHFTPLHLFTPNPHSNSPACNYILNPFLNVYSLQQKDANKPTCNWFQLLMVLFTKGYLPTSVLCFLVLIFRL